MNDHDRPESEAADGIAFEFRRGDVFDAARLYKWEKMVGPPLAVPVVLLGIFSLLAVVPDPVFEPPSKVFAFLGSWPVVAILLVGVATLNIVFWRKPWRIVDQVFEGTGEPVEVVFEMDEDGFRYESLVLACDVGWEEVLHARESADLFVVVVHEGWGFGRKTSTYPIRKDALDEEAIDLLRERLDGPDHDWWEQASAGNSNGDPPSHGPEEVPEDERPSRGPEKPG